MKFWINIISRGKWAIILLWLALIGISVTIIPSLAFRVNLGAMLRGSDARVEEMREFYNTFPPSDGHVMISISDDKVLTIDSLRSAAKWAEEIEALEEVQSVLSPKLLLDVKMDGFTLDEWSKLGGLGTEELVLGSGSGMEFFQGNLVSRDLKSVALYLIKSDSANIGQLHDAVREFVSSPREGGKIRIVGTEFLLEEMGGVLESDFFSLLKYQLIMLVIVVPLFMRSLRSAYLPIFTALSALLVYLAVFATWGGTFGLMHLAGPGLILVIGLADAIHLQQRFDDSRAKGASIASSLQFMYSSAGHACFLTSLTTFFAFACLAFSKNEQVHDFGLWCAIGVMTSYFIVMLFFPVALLVFPGVGKIQKGRNFINPAVTRRFAVAVMVILGALSFGTFFVSVDSSLEREFPRNSQIVEDNNWFAENFRGLDRIEVDLHADLSEYDVFFLVDRMQRELREFPGISGSRSYVDMVKMLLASEVLESPDGPTLGVNALGSAGAFPTHLLNRDADRACIVFYRSGNFGTENYEAFREEIQRFAEELPETASMQLNGSFPMFYDSTVAISETLILSLISSLFIITLTLIVVFRSWKLALLSLVPNVIPILVVTGISGWLGAPLHLGILVVFSVGLGLAVDDTIHIMTSFTQLRRKRPEADTGELMDSAIKSSGFAIFLTSVILFLVGLCFLNANFTTLRWIGVTLAIVAITALLADLFVLPWLMQKFVRPASIQKSNSTTP